ncbi:murein biosynthesis integral membrane protein MurJ [Actinomadura madurae]|uniref:Putative peptidoglycan lipid II flippase n=1 Tax=Actinomadura madurae TaxID=1993 RepID=A0A1I4Z9F8_9ACTN|nr:murein biosynthesis integral membrane protein MurJ [Actinomadura madurae]SFN46921.1 putative peptidoglycan lipid II flippase [Actinomadura madurae]
MSERDGRRILMPGVLDEAERAEPPGEPEPGLVPVRDPGDVADPGTADRPGSEGDEIGGAAQAAPPGVAHSSAVMAIGTVFSRLTGFLRTVVIGAALGTALLGDAYQAAEMIPYTVYELLLGGMLASVFVPFLVKRRIRDADGGAATENRLLTAVIVALAVLTAAAVLAAGWLVSLYAGGYTGRQREVTVLLTRLLLAQIFFIGVSGLASTLLNVRHRFGAPMWAPVVNNLVTMGAGLLFLWVAGRGRTTANVTDAQLTLLGLGSALGTVAQSAVLAWTLRSAGFRWRPRLDLRGSGFGEAARTATWMLLYIVVAQAGVLVTANVATRAGDRAAGPGSGLATYKFALVVFQLPYAIIAVSVITALLPRMSAHVADGRRDLVRADLSRGLRLACALLVPLWLGMLVFAIPGSVTFFAYGSLTPDGARRIGLVLMVFAVMVLPFTVHQLLMRVFYALGDTRTPGLIAVPAGIAQAAAAFALLWSVPARQVVVGLPVAYGLFYALGAAGAALVLRRRLGGLDGRRILRALVRLHLAALPAVAFAALIVWAFGHLSGDRVPALLAVLVGGAGGGAIYYATASLMRIPEIGYFTAMAAARLRRS